MESNLQKEECSTSSTYPTFLLATAHYFYEKVNNDLRLIFYYNQDEVLGTTNQPCLFRQMNGYYQPPPRSTKANLLTTAAVQVFAEGMTILN